MSLAGRDAGIVYPASKFPWAPLRAPALPAGIALAGVRELLAFATHRRMRPPGFGLQVSSTTFSGISERWREVPA
jgi:hypothetical protein